MKGFEPTVRDRESDRNPTRPPIRFFLLERRFLIAITLVGLLAISIGLMLPKIWVTSNSGVNPVIRISALDYIQARSLASSGQALEASGRFAEATQCWRSAIANDPANFHLSERFIFCILNQKDVSQQSIYEGVNQAVWLLHITRTNSASVAIAARMFTAADLHEEAWKLLTRSNTPINSDALRFLAIAAFETDQSDSFAKIWDSNQERFRDDAELQLYHSAWRAIWGPPTQSAAALEFLTQACKSSAYQVLALRLKIVVEAHRLDSDRLDGALAELQELRGDRVQEHVRSWLLHDYLGQHQIARAKAMAYAVPPRSVLQAELLLKAWKQIGLHEFLVQFAKTQLDGFRNSPRIWVDLARILYASKHWDDLRSLAAHIRSIHQLAPLLGGYTDFLDGLSEYGLQNQERADQLFKNILRNPPADAGLAYEAADILADMGQTVIAQTLLLPHEAVLGDRPYYWVKLAVCAHANRQADLLLAAAKRGYALAPRDLALANNYALALLIDRSQPAEAIRLTVELIAAFPKSPSIRIHHALALIRNGRLLDGRRTLSSIRLDSLGPEERTYWYLAQFEAAVASREFGRARKCLKAIDSQFLFRPQIDWLTEAAQNLPFSGDAN